MEQKKLQLYNCDRCGFTFRKHILKKQRGMLLCNPCLDSLPLDLEPLHVRWRSPRANSTSTDPMSQPIVFTITASGVTSLGQSQSYQREGTRNSYVMHVVGSGAVVVSGDPQIAVAPNGTLLTLVGTSDTNTIYFETANNLILTSPITLGSGNILTVVYDAGAQVWRETSRS